MRRSQGRPFSDYEIGRVINLLKNTDLSMPAIAESVGCSRTAVCNLNRKFGIRQYGKQRSQWTLRRPVSAQSSTSGQEELETVEQRS